MKEPVYSVVQHHHPKCTKLKFICHDLYAAIQDENMMLDRINKVFIPRPRPAHQEVWQRSMKKFDCDVEIIWNHKNGLAASQYR